MYEKERACRKQETSAHQAKFSLVKQVKYLYQKVENSLRSPFLLLSHQSWFQERLSAETEDQCVSHPSHSL